MILFSSFTNVIKIMLIISGEKLVKENFKNLKKQKLKHTKEKMLSKNLQREDTKEKVRKFEIKCIKVIRKVKVAKG